MLTRFVSHQPVLLISQEGTITSPYLRLRPTYLCFMLLVLSVAIWLAAVNYQVNVAYAVCFWLLGWVGMAAVLTRRQLQGLTIELTLAEEVFVGQQANVLCRIHQPNAKKSRLFWWRGEYAVNINENNPHTFSKWQRIFMSSGSLKQELHWQIPIQQRGHFSRDLFLKLATSAPFGLFQVECRVQWQSAAVAFAAPLPHHDWGNALQEGDAAITQRASMRGDDIAYLKPHQAGASLQYIAWKVYAKRGELMDKVFDEPPAATHRETISYRDYPQGMPIDKLASLLTYRVLQADKAAVAYTLELPHVTIAPQNGLREKCLYALAVM